MSTLKLIDLEMFQHSATEKAVRVSQDGTDSKAVWLPLSAIEMEPVRGNIVMVTLPETLAFEKGLI